MEEKVLVVDANARGNGKRFSTLDVIGVGPRLITSLFRYYNLDAKLVAYESVAEDKQILEHYDALAISFMISDVGAVRRLINAWTRHNDGPIILGGGGALSNKVLSFLDFSLAFKGDAEVTLWQLFKEFRSLKEAYETLSKERRTIKGLAIKTGEGNIIDGGLGIWTPKSMLNVIPVVEDLKTFPFYWASRIYVEVVRGCSNFRRAKYASGGIKCIDCGLCYTGPLNNRLTCPLGIPPGCGYCSVPTVHGPARSRNIYIIAEEVEKLAKLGASRIVLSAPDFLDFGRDELVDGHLTDPCNPPPNIEAIEKLLRELSKIPEVSSEKTVIMIENLKPCLVNEDVAEILGRYLRDTAVYMGVESCSDDLLIKIGRPATSESILKALELLRKYGLRPYVYLMHGIPGETAEDIKKTIDCIDHLKRIGVEKITLYRFTPLPYTAFEGFPRPPPAVKDEVRKILYERVIAFNTEQKRSLVGKLIKAIVAGKHPHKKGFLIAYPQKHGPVILLQGSSKLVGHKVVARIEKVINDRVVIGSVIYVHERYL